MNNIDLILKSQKKVFDEINKTLFGKTMDEMLVRQEPNVCLKCQQNTPDEHFILQVGLCEGCYNDMQKAEEPSIYDN